MVAYCRKGGARRAPLRARCKGTVANGNIHRIGPVILLRAPQERAILPPVTAGVNAEVWYSRAASAPRVVRESSSPQARPPRPFDRVREAARVRHYSRRTERAYLVWIRRFIFFHEKRHPAEMSAPEITKSLSWLAVGGNVAPWTKNQPLRALSSCIAMCSSRTCR